MYNYSKNRFNTTGVRARFCITSELCLNRFVEIEIFTFVLVCSMYAQIVSICHGANGILT